MTEADRLEDRGTRDRVSREILHHGPVTASDLAATLGLTPAAVRRHLDTLTEQGLVCTWDPPEGAPRRRGRPARLFVLTDMGHSAMSTAYDDLAVHLLEFLADTAGPEAVRDFAAVRAERLAQRYRPAVEAAGEDPHHRAGALAQALSTDGYAASVRSLTERGAAEVAPGTGKQLCQGHCPVQQVAAQFPQLCEAETDAFSSLLGVHVQRLATLAHGEHVCTTHIPLGAVTSSLSKRTESTEASENPEAPENTASTTTSRPPAHVAPDVMSDEENAADEHRVAS
ncbi:helix-turn-helix transcriptional regulator [Kineosporia babensis]|uniref:helix-turn-helix transcriptional regulator n=1 Tax=Kineosporia babensis TaxID=499548 RepID=UPI0022AFE48E|nr:helix-turn-helix domain-containing protein [Kineosporia babensis]